MASQIKTRRVGASATGSRKVLLAGLGAVSLARKQAARSVAQAQEIRDVGVEIASGLIDASAQRAATLRRRLDRKLQPLVADAQATAGLIVDQAGALVTPILRKVGLAPAPRVRRRKAA